LKSAVLRYIQTNHPDGNISESDLNNISASFQKALVSALMKNVILALNNYKVKSLSLVGGVAANKKLRNEFENLAKKINVSCIIPSLEYCSDNAAMIALRGYQLYQTGFVGNLNAKPYPSIPENHFLRLN
jgi:N6-L-threonylcarbamoyladenine synthase